MQGGDETQETLDLENRVLCSDGACIGVIGADGRCRECGKVFEGKWPLPGMMPPVQESVSAAPDAAAEASRPQGSSGTDEDPDWDSRILCSDGACIGVIGTDGRCKECGKSGAEAAASAPTEDR